MSYVDFTTPAIEMAKQATTLDEQQKYKEALDLYTKSVDHFLTAMKYEKNQKKKDMLKDKVKDIMDRAEQIKEHLKNNDDSTQGDPTGGVTKDKSK